MVSVESLTQCDVCETVLSSRKSLNRHMKVHSPTDEEKKKCIVPGCEFKSWEQSNVDKHWESQHSGREHVCVECNWTTRYLSNLIRHRKKLHKYEPTPKATKKEVKEAFSLSRSRQQQASEQAKVAAKRKRTRSKKVARRLRSFTATSSASSPEETPAATPALSSTSFTGSGFDSTPAPDTPMNSDLQNHIEDTELLREMLNRYVAAFLADPGLDEGKEMRRTSGTERRIDDANVTFGLESAICGLLSLRYR